MTYKSEKYASNIVEKNDRNGLPYQVKYEFPNGFGASVIQGPYTYGSDQGLYELAVIANGGICYDTPITNDVLGYLTEADVDNTLAQIEALGNAADVLRDAEIADIEAEIASHLDAVDALTKKLKDLT